MSKDRGEDWIGNWVSGPRPMGPHYRCLGKPDGSGWAQTQFKLYQESSVREDDEPEKTPDEPAPYEDPSSPRLTKRKTITKPDGTSITVEYFQ